MKYYNPKFSTPFVGRVAELKLLNEIHTQKKASVIVIYGRRRVGKTELIEKFFVDKNLLKFEGLQVNPDLEKKDFQVAVKRQIQECVTRLGDYLENEKIYKQAYNKKCKLLKLETWRDFFELINPIATKEKVTLYFEEIQWLAVYQDSFFSEMKPFWDDHWRHNQNLRIVCSGSSPSFVLGQFLSNKAMYNRTEHLIHLAPFTLQETDLFFRKMGLKEKLLVTLCLGGTPGYLKQIDSRKSVQSEVAKHFFSSNGNLFHEFGKIFVSSMSHRKHYREVIEYLAHQRFATRDQINKDLKISDGQMGGSKTQLFTDLVDCGFIRNYTPIQLRSEHSKLVRYTISDEYLNFYFRMVKPLTKKIVDKVFDDQPEKALNQNRFSIMLGLAFERWCCKNYRLIAKILKFDGIVDYEAGSFFNKPSQKDDSGFQIDLMFIRKDLKIILVEIRYSEGEVSTNVISDILAKKEKLLKYWPKFSNYTIEQVLVTTAEIGSKKRVLLEHTFDRIITLKDLFAFEA